MKALRDLLRASMIAVALVACAAAAGGQTAATEPDYADEEFARQLQEVQRKFPLVANGLSFLQGVAFQCNVDEVCFDKLQNVCLRTVRDRNFCFEESRKFCCEPLVLQPTQPTPPVSGPVQIVDLTGVRVVDPGRRGGPNPCPPPKPPDIGCRRLCKPCITFICVDGEWEPLRIDFPEPLCQRTQPTDPPLTSCPRTADMGCPAECHLCF